MSYNETLERQYLHSIPQEGKVEWIGIRTKRMAEVHSVSEVLANPDTGLEGDHFKKSSTGKRQVTLIQQDRLIQTLHTDSTVGCRYLTYRLWILKCNHAVVKRLAVDSQEVNYVAFEDTSGRYEVGRIKKVVFEQNRFCFSG